MPDEPRRADADPFEIRWRERFADFARRRDDDAGIAGWSASGLEARMRRFLSVWKPRADASAWLDAGCGAGTYARLLESRGLSVVGVDYSVPSIVKAKERSGSTIAFAVADVGRLPFRRASFEGALCFGVTQALAQSGPAVRELADVLKPGGELWVDALNRACIVNLVRIAWRRLRGRKAHLRYEWPATMRAAFAAAGVVDVKLHWMPIVPGRWPRLQRMAESAVTRRLLAAVPVCGAFLSHSFIVCGVKHAVPAEPRA